MALVCPLRWWCTTYARDTARHSLVSATLISSHIETAHEAARRSTICEVARGVGEWMVFLCAIISPGISPADDTHAHRRDADTRGKWFRHRHRHSRKYSYLCYHRRSGGTFRSRIRGYRR